MTARIQSLINKKDTFEIVRDLIAQILADETAEQQQLAIAGGENSELWKLRVFTERSNPWELFQNDEPGVDIDMSPLVNVWYDNSSFDMSKSNVVERQMTTGTFNIDIYGYGRSEDNPVGGHIPGDQSASFTAQRGLRLVRNILMSSYYTFLGVAMPQNVIGQRWVQGITAYQPEQGKQLAQNIAAMRLTFAVKFNEFSPQYEGEILEKVAVDIERAEDGSILAQVEYNF